MSDTSSAASERKKRLLRDLCLFLSLCVPALTLLLGAALFRPKGNTVEVRLKGDLILSCPLSKDAVIPIDAGEGESNLLVIENGCASVIDASCPDLICVKHRPIRYAGESILCLPHALTVSVTGENAADFVQ